MAEIGREFFDLVCLFSLSQLTNTFDFLLCFNQVMYTSFLNNFEKFAEDESKLKQFGEGLKKSAPWILGMGAGSVAADVLRRQLPQIKNPAIKNVAKIGAPIAGAALTYMLLPKIHDQFKKDVFGSSKEDLP